MKTKEQFKHTPGPWEYAYNGDGHEITMPEYNDGGIKDVARFIEWNHGIEPDQEEQFTEAESNAKLIAAAPELLKTLLYVKDVIETSQAAQGDWWIDSPDKGGFDLKIIDDVIKKATI